MASNCLTEQMAIEALRSFFREKPFLFFGTGMSCALDTRFGMAALKNALLTQMRTQSLTPEEENQWVGVESSLQVGADLETALNGVSEQGLLNKITDVTGGFIASIDRQYAFRIAKGESVWPATCLIKKLVATLPEGDRILHVLTPNYDMMFEYACDFSRIPYTNGFSGGVEREMNWNAVDCSLRSRERVTYGRNAKFVCKHKKHVRLYKVHGSLNYFFHRNAVIENNAWMWDAPDFAQRVMITPGLSKYEKLQRYRQELLKSADAAINRASQFLFLGYGFNDNHLEEYIKRKLITQACKGLIVTRDSNPRIESMLAQAANLWVVCKSEGAKMGTRVFNKRYTDWLRLPNRRLWEITEFTTHILGGVS